MRVYFQAERASSSFYPFLLLRNKVIVLRNLTEARKELPRKAQSAVMATTMTGQCAGGSFCSTDVINYCLQHCVHVTECPVKFTENLVKSTVLMELFSKFLVNVL